MRGEARIVRENCKGEEQKASKYGDAACNHGRNPPLMDARILPLLALQVMILAVNFFQRRYLIPPTGSGQMRQPQPLSCRRVRFGEIDSQDVRQFLSVYSTPTSPARGEPSRPTQTTLKIPDFSPMQRLHLDLHSHLKRNARLQFRAELTERNDPGILRKRPVVGQHAGNPYRAPNVHAPATAEWK